MPDLISSTTFLNFTTAKSTDAKISELKKAKYSEYMPAADYYKPLRESFIKILCNNEDPKLLLKVADSVNEKKRDSYRKIARNLVKFLKNNNVQYFDTGKAYVRASSDLSISAKPDFGAYVNGIPYLIKVNYRKNGKDRSINKRNVNTNLVLMALSEKEFQTPDGTLTAILNGQNGTLIPLENEVSNSDKLKNTVDINYLVDIWQRI
ncbi:hypothetical protein ACX2QB_06010 [Weissella viridescens]